ncbi:unnamed protein product [Psylliodes chrysocephalus]|uniref:Uncharacterized protein n=1 Tax=Psylliodes chrysocephalus TaxID=3402493 RepID=A0A9P0D5P1_9CUCU|nr:unnamed protein product [Psylliodes chrysocephala]
MKTSMKYFFFENLLDPSFSAITEEPNKKDPDFQLSPEDTDSSESHENISNVQNDKLNADDPQEESLKRKRSIKYEMDNNRWEKNKNCLNREKGKETPKCFCEFFCTSLPKKRGGKISNCLRFAISKATKYRIKENTDFKKKVELLKRDILNVFCEHSE